jgi:hypothetical protein
VCNAAGFCIGVSVLGRHPHRPWFRRRLGQRVGRDYALRARAAGSPSARSSGTAVGGQHAAAAVDGIRSVLGWRSDEVERLFAVSARSRLLRTVSVFGAVLTVELESGAQTGGGRDHRRSSGVDGVDHLRVVDPLEIYRRDPKMGMPELALDDRQRDPFVRHLDSVRVAELMVVPTSAQTSLRRHDRYAETVEKSLLRRFGL